MPEPPERPERAQSKAPTTPARAVRPAGAALRAPTMTGPAALQALRSWSHPTMVPPARSTKAPAGLPVRPQAPARPSRSRAAQMGPAARHPTTVRPGDSRPVPAERQPQLKATPTMGAAAPLLGAVVARRREERMEGAVARRPVAVRPTPAPGTAGTAPLRRAALPAPPRRAERPRPRSARVQPHLAQQAWRRVGLRSTPAVAPEAALGEQEAMPAIPTSLDRASQPRTRADPSSVKPRAGQPR